MKSRYKIVILLVSVLIFTGCGDILEGDKGPTGSTGISGSSGVDGNDGSNGVDGNDGSNGVDGTNTSPAGVINNGIVLEHGTPLCKVYLQYHSYNLANQDVAIQITTNGNVIVSGLQTISSLQSYTWYSELYTCDEYNTIRYTVVVNNEYTVTGNIE